MGICYSDCIDIIPNDEDTEEEAEEEAEEECNVELEETIEEVQTNEMERKDTIEIPFFVQKEYTRDTTLLETLRKMFSLDDRNRRSKPCKPLVRRIEKVEVETNEERKEILKIFEGFRKWNFEIIRLSELTNGYPLIYVSYVSMILYDMFNKFGIMEEDFLCLVEKIQSCYFNNNQFHNCSRSASILHTFIFLLRRGLIEFISDELILSFILSCCMIYMYHPGLNNQVQVRMNSFPSTVFKNESVLENSSVFMFMNLVLESNHQSPSPFNIFQNTSTTPQSLIILIRETIKDMILGTDFANMSSLLQDFFSRLEEGSEFSSRDDLGILLQVSMLCCSLDYCCKSFTQYRFWSEQLMLENYQQHEYEELKKFSSDPLPLFRSAEEVSKYSRKFSVSRHHIRFLHKVKRLFKSYIEVFPRLKLCTLGNLRKNLSYWTNQFPTPDYLDRSFFTKDHLMKYSHNENNENIRTPELEKQQQTYIRIFQNFYSQPSIIINDLKERVYFIVESLTGSDEVHFSPFSEDHIIVKISGVGEDSISLSKVFLFL